VCRPEQLLELLKLLDNTGGEVASRQSGPGQPVLPSAGRPARDRMVPAGGAGGRVRPPAPTRPRSQSPRFSQMPLPRRGPNCGLIRHGGPAAAVTLSTSEERDG
jgi:hypothetical protein